MKEWVLITGASSGIGKAIAIELSKAYNLVLNGRDERRLNETAASLAKGCRKRIWNYDLGQIEEIGAALTEFLSISRITISRFVHAAGVSKIMPVNVTRVEDVRNTFGVNTMAPFEIVKVLSSKRGNSSALKNVVFVSSAISKRGARGHTIYGASKAALDGMMRGLAVELAPKVRVNSVLPGFVKTPMTEAVLTNVDVVERLEAQYPLGRGWPKSVADAGSYLLSDRANWITGHELVVDGGSSIDYTA